MKIDNGKGFSVLLLKRAQQAQPMKVSGGSSLMGAGDYGFDHHAIMWSPKQATKKLAERAQPQSGHQNRDLRYIFIYKYVKFDHKCACAVIL